jgi:hypothetical protein
MNQRLSDSEVAPAVYKAMLALQASVDTSGLEKDLMDLVPAHFTSQEVNAPTPTSIAASNRSINSKSRTARARFTFGRNGTYYRPTGTTSSLS